MQMAKCNRRRVVRQKRLLNASSAGRSLARTQWRPWCADMCSTRIASSVGWRSLAEPRPSVARTSATRPWSCKPPRRTSQLDAEGRATQTPPSCLCRPHRPCARCNLEPIDTVWRPFWRFLVGERMRRRRRRRQDDPSDSAVLPPRFILQGVASASPVSTESQVEDTEDPLELQRLHDAWLAKEFFYKKKKNYFYGPRECPDCGTLLSYSAMARHRRFNCKSRQPVALDGVRQGRPAEKDAVLEAPPPPEAPLDVAESSDRRAASRSRSPRAPRRRGPSQMWIEALQEAQRSLAAEGMPPRGRVRQRAQEFMEQWRKENKERELMESKGSDSD